MIINTLWIGSELPLLQRMCAASWVAHGHQLHLWTYQDLAGIPAGVSVEDANEVFCCPIQRYTDENHRGSPVLHANLFRYRFLRDRGGAFVDADTLCLAAFDFGDRECVFSSENNDAHPNLAFVFVRDHGTDFARRLDAEASARLGMPFWGHFGPKLLKLAIAEFRLTSHVLPPHVFCPIKWNETPQLFQAEPPALDGSLGIHLFQQVLTQSGRDLTAASPATSLWEKWKREFT